MMNLKLVKTKKEYLAILDEFEKLFQTKPINQEAARANILAVLIKQYDEKKPK